MYKNIVIENLLKFCESKKNIFIYGAGKYGKCTYEILDGLGVKVDGFVTTDGDSYLYNLKVYSIRDLKIDEGDGIILALNNEHLKSVQEEVNIPTDTFIVSEYEMVYIEEYTILNKLHIFDTAPEIRKNVKLNGNMKNILVVQCEVTYGDLIWSTAFLRELKYNLNDSSIDLITTVKYIDLFRNCPYVNNVYGYESKTLIEPLSEHSVKCAREYYRNNIRKAYDTVFLPRLLPNNIADSWENIVLALESRANNRYAHAYYITDSQKAKVDMLSPYFTNISKHIQGQHEVISDLSLICDNGGEVKDDNMELWPSEEDYLFADRILIDSLDKECGESNS